MKDLAISLLVGILALTVVLLALKVRKLDRLATARMLALRNSEIYNDRMQHELNELRGIIRAREDIADHTVELDVAYLSKSEPDWTWPPTPAQSAHQLLRRPGLYEL